MYTPTLVTTPAELHQIAALSKENLRTGLLEEEKQSQGFITWEYPFKLLQQLHSIAPSVIVKYQEEVVGYALTAFKESSKFQLEMVGMIDHLETLAFDGRPVKDYTYYIMGQVCIAKAHRGKGIFDMLYQYHQTVFQKQFELVVTEISTSNHRSVQAHKKIGFQTINTYRDALDEWDVVVWDWH